MNEISVMFVQACIFVRMCDVARGGIQLVRSSSSARQHCLHNCWTFRSLLVLLSHELANRALCILPLLGHSRGRLEGHGAAVV